jgi:hypothetical protein
MHRPRPLRCTLRAGRKFVRRYTGEQPWLKKPANRRKTMTAALAAPVFGAGIYIGGGLLLIILIVVLLVWVL